ncbi:hypothetical protein RclHR1_01000021 [Rhizophagus clarus]|uniref:Uncharacterized protein n=1 Tax=Rhizophagus clarus TaxID=94130 RepID=A0A2Z6Q1H9_9GLOM|nr:hypothetical protein RclHR1_01000021 [Rhizophagus clarus]GES94063.1 hypothetical protein GLOIN_2v1499844 [Rhizophagus clarus]
MRSTDRRYWCRTHSSFYFLGCPIDFKLVDLSVLKNNSSSSEEDDDDCYDEDEKYEFLNEYVEKNYGSLFYLGKATVAADLTEWEARYEVYLAFHLPYDDDETLTIPKLKNFFSNFDISKVDQFRALMKLLKQPEEDSEPGLCSCHYTIG